MFQLYSTEQKWKRLLLNVYVIMTSTD